VKTILIAILVAQLADGGSDAPLRPPELVDELGNVTVMRGTEDLEPGMVCLVHEQAVKVRDDKVACHAALQTMQAGSGIDWPILLGVSGVALVLGAALGAGVAVAAQSKR
jgi:hypothetical protein